MDSPTSRRKQAKSTGKAAGGATVATSVNDDSEGEGRVSPSLLNRLKQEFSLALFMATIPMAAVCWLVWLYLLFLNKYTAVLMLTYVAWIFLVDKSSVNGTRTPYMKYLSFWRHYREYFPLHLIKTADIDSNQKLVFGYHPHGILGLGAIGNFATDSTGFSKKFPGINLRLISLPVNFRVPFFREYMMAYGMCESSMEACRTILSHGPGNAIMLVIGGAAEALLSKPGTYNLRMGRKGFVRVAVAQGAGLVPVLSFGETDMFSVVDFEPGSLMSTLQQKAKKIMGFSMPVFLGRSWLPRGLGFRGLMPYRRSITTVVGPVIPTQQYGGDLMSGEGAALVDKYHAQYVEALKELWAKYKDNVAPGRRRVSSLCLLD